MGILCLSQKELIRFNLDGAFSETDFKWLDIHSDNNRSMFYCYFSFGKITAICEIQNSSNINELWLMFVQVLDKYKRKGICRKLILHVLSDLNRKFKDYFLIVSKYSKEGELSVKKVLTEVYDRFDLNIVHSVRNGPRQVISSKEFLYNDKILVIDEKNKYFGKVGIISYQEDQYECVFVLFYGEQSPVRFYLNEIHFI